MSDGVIDGSEPDAQSDGLAPVIPLFGGGRGGGATARGNAAASGRGDRRSGADPEDVAVDRLATARETLARAAAAAKSPAWPQPSPVEITSGAEATTSAGQTETPADPEAWHPTWSEDRVDRLRAVEGDAPADDRTAEAEKALLKKLRSKALSISEAKTALREHDLSADESELVITAIVEYGYLDDAALAEQLIYAGAERKGQGRQVIAMTLAKRGIPRDVADAALAALPDDDLERALEFARSKVRSLRDLDREVAVRRLAGQLARRGYGSSVALTAARTALDERGSGDRGGVRFV